MTIFQELEDLTPIQKEILERRYLPLLQNLQKRTRNHAIVFYMGHFIITVGSLFVPALLSIQNSDREYALTGGAFNVHIYWSTFIISLLVTIWNAVLTLFRIDKKYYFLNTMLERLRSEGWQYASLTGRYSGHLLEQGIVPTHANQFVHFTHYIEKMKMKQIEEEYYRTDEKSQAPPSAGTGSTILIPSSGSYGTAGGNQVVIPLYSPSPDKPIPAMNQSYIPETIRQAHDTLAQSQRTPMEQSFTQLRSSYQPMSPARPTGPFSPIPAPAPTPAPATPAVTQGVVASAVTTYRQLRKQYEQAHGRQ